MVAQKEELDVEMAAEEEQDQLESDLSNKEDEVASEAEPAPEDEGSSQDEDWSEDDEVSPEGESGEDEASGALIAEAEEPRASSPQEAMAELAREAEERALEEADLGEPQDERAWYVIHCYSGREHKVKHKLDRRIQSLGMEDKIFQVVVPTEDEMELRQGERRTVERRIFPGYLLVQMILDDESWYTVRDTPGVIGFVGMGDKPTPLRTAEVSGIMERMEAEAPKIKVTFETGEKVRIVDGPFDGFIGVVDSIDMERATVHVMVSFFGRETPVELDFLQVERI